MPGEQSETDRRESFAKTESLLFVTKQKLSERRGERELIVPMAAQRCCWTYRDKAIQYPERWLMNVSSWLRAQLR
jgi:predicted Zn-ribbon and HTH transcriptional regulator